MKLGMGYFIGDSEVKKFYKAVNVSPQTLVLSGFELMLKGERRARLKIAPRRGIVFALKRAPGKICSYWSSIDDLIVTLGWRAKSP